MASFRGWAMRNPFGASTATSGNETTTMPNSSENTALFEARGSPGGTVDTSWSSDSDDEPKGTLKGRRTPQVQHIINETSQLWGTRNPPEHNATPANVGRMVSASVLQSLFDTSGDDLVTPRRQDQPSSPLPRAGSTTPTVSPRTRSPGTFPTPTYTQRRSSSSAHLELSDSPNTLPRPPFVDASTHPSSRRGSRTSLKSILKRSSSPFPTHDPVRDEAFTTPGGTKLRWVADDDFEVAEISARTGSESDGDIGRALRGSEVEGEVASPARREAARSPRSSAGSSGSSKGSADMSVCSEEGDLSSGDIGRPPRAGTTSPACSPPPSVRVDATASRAVSTSPLSSPPQPLPTTSSPRHSPLLDASTPYSQRSVADDSFDPSSLLSGAESPLVERHARQPREPSFDDSNVIEDSFDGSSLVPADAAGLGLGSGLGLSQLGRGGPSQLEEAEDEEVAEAAASLGPDWGWQTGDGPTGMPSPLKEEESWEVRAMSETSGHEDGEESREESREESPRSILADLDAGIRRPSPARSSPASSRRGTPTPSVRGSPSAAFEVEEDDDLTPIRKVEERRSLNSRLRGSTSPLASDSPLPSPSRRSPSPPKPTEEFNAFTTPVRWATRSARASASASEEEGRSFNADEEPRFGSMSDLDATTEDFETFSTPWATPAVTRTVVMNPGLSPASPMASEEGEVRQRKVSPLAQSHRPGSPWLKTAELPDMQDEEQNAQPSLRQREARSSPRALSPRNVPLPPSPDIPDLDADPPSASPIAPSPAVSSGRSSRRSTPSGSPKTTPLTSASVTPPNSTAVPSSLPYHTPNLSTRPLQIVPGRSPAWQTSLVRTPSRLAQSFTPGSPSSASEASASPAKSDRSTPASEGRRSRRNSVSPTPMEPSPSRGSTMQRAESVPIGLDAVPPTSPFTGGGEVRIVSRSVDQPTRAVIRASQSFALSTPSKSFGFDFSSPLAIRDWSIQRSREMEAEELELSMSMAEGQEEDAEIEVVDEIEHEVEEVEERDDANEVLREVEDVPEDGETLEVDEVVEGEEVVMNDREGEQGCDIKDDGGIADQSACGEDREESEISYVGPEHLGASFGVQTNKEHHPFNPRVSIAPLPDFSPLGLPSFRRPAPGGSLPRNHAVSTRGDESPLAKKTPRNVGIPSSASAPALLSRKLSLPTFSPLNVPQVRKPPPSPPQAEDDEMLRDMVKFIPSPENTPAKDAAPAARPPTEFTTPAKSVAFDKTVYFSPSLFMEEQPSLRSDSDGDDSLAAIVAPDGTVIRPPADGKEEEERFVKLVQGLINAQDALLTHRNQRYGIVMSLAENLRQDLVMKDEMVHILEQDKSQAELARDEAITKARELQERVKQVAQDQQAERKQQYSRFEGIVSKLSSAISASSAERRANPEIARLSAQLEEAKNAVVAVQPLLDSYREANADLEASNAALTKQLEDANGKAASTSQATLDQVAEKDRLLEDLRGVLERQVGALQARAEESAQTEEALKARASMLEEELNIQWSAAEDLAVQKQELVEQNQGLQKENNDLRHRAERSTAQQVTITNERERIVADLIAKVAMLEEEQRDRLDALAELRSRARSAEDNAAKAFAARDDVVLENLELSRTVATLQQEAGIQIERLSRLDATEAELQRLKTDFLRYQKTAETALREQRRHSDGLASFADRPAEEELARYKSQLSKVQAASADQEGASAFPTNESR